MPIQVQYADQLVMPWTHWFFLGDTGSGKCLGLGTPVILYGGRVVPVEDVVRGNTLLGPCGAKRTVLGTTRGRGPLYRIEPRKGDPWVCNDVHVMTLVNTRTDEVRDVPLNEYLTAARRSTRYAHEWKLLRSGAVDLGNDDNAAPPIDPYFLGVWFGDGTKHLTRVEVSKPDLEIRTLMETVATEWGLRVTVQDEDRCPRFSIVGAAGSGANPLLTALREAVGAEVRVPAWCLRGALSTRAQFLAGLVDTDGHLHNGTIDIVQKRRDYADAVAFVARSLGLRATLRAKQIDGYGTYWRVTLSGDLDAIPTRIARKVALPRRQRKDVRRTSFRVVSLGEGDYAGFELDGDGRFLLGDFTITHNTRNASTFPYPIFIVPKNEQSIVTLRGLRIPYIEISTSHEMNEAVTYLEQGHQRAAQFMHAGQPDQAWQSFPYQTVVFESISHYGDLLIEDLTGGDGTISINGHRVGAGGKGNALHKMDQQKWGLLGSHLRNLHSRMRNLPVHTIFTALAQVKESESGAVSGGPLMSGAMSYKLPSACDAIGYCEQAPTSPPSWRVWFKKYKQFSARMRTPPGVVSPECVDDFSWDKVRGYFGH